MRYVLSLIFFFSAFADAGVLFQDPSGRDLNEEYDKLSAQQVKNITPPDLAKKKYLLGLLYLNGDQEFDIEKDCSNAVSLLTEAWEAEVVDAGQALATMYYRGVCLERDLDKARELVFQTAEEGFILSQRMLGESYLNAGWDDLNLYDLDKGVFWLSEAGEAGDRESAARLAGMYNDGDGVVKSDAKYFKWLKKAVFNRFEPRNMLGFPVLAECYENGKGTDVDLVQAYKYYDLSGSAGVEGKQRIADQMTQDQIDEALHQSQEWQDEHNVRVGGGLIRRMN